MSTFSTAVRTAAEMVVSLDASLVEIALLSLRVSATATLIGAAIALPLAAWVAQSRSRARGVIVAVL
ncbi:MAG: ABC transporter permease, partial [Casimicrobium sp.]